MWFVHKRFTITNVSITKDMKTIYVFFMSNVKSTESFLKKKEFLLKREMVNNLKLRSIPKIFFKRYLNMDSFNRVDELLTMCKKVNVKHNA